MILINEPKYFIDKFIYNNENKITSLYFRSLEEKYISNSSFININSFYNNYKFITIYNYINGINDISICNGIIIDNVLYPLIYNTYTNILMSNIFNPILLVNNLDKLYNINFIKGMYFNIDKYILRYIFDYQYWVSDELNMIIKLLEQYNYIILFSSFEHILNYHNDISDVLDNHKFIISLLKRDLLKNKYIFKNNNILMNDSDYYNIFTTIGDKNHFRSYYGCDINEIINKSEIYIVNNISSFTNQDNYYLNMFYLAIYDLYFFSRININCLITLTSNNNKYIFHEYTLLNYINDNLINIEDNCNYIGSILDIIYIIQKLYKIPLNYKNTIIYQPNRNELFIIFQYKDSIKTFYFQLLWLILLLSPSIVFETND